MQLALEAPTLMTYWQGDSPQTDLGLHVKTTDGDAILDVRLFDATAVLTHRDGGLSVPLAVSHVPDEDDVEMPGHYLVTWPDGFAFTAAGLHSIRLSLTAKPVEGQPVNVRMRTAPLYFVVEDMASGWMQLDDARQDWSDAPVSDVRLYGLLEAARLAVLTYAPVSDRPAAAIPQSWREAQLMQAKAIDQLTRDGMGERVGPEGFAVRVYPLDWNVKQLLRPDNGRKYVP